MTIRMLTTETRRRLEEILSRLGNGETVSLEERIQLRKYATHIPFMAGKLTQAIRKRESLDINGIDTMLEIAHTDGLDDIFPNRVELWKARCHNPLRRVTRRGTPSVENTDALILLLCSMKNLEIKLLPALLLTLLKMIIIIFFH